VLGGGGLVAIVNAREGGERWPRLSTATTVNVYAWAASSRGTAICVAVTCPSAWPSRNTR
jgi:hypothetical protein